MIIGGSNGFRMITALPRSAPPTRSIARAVVVVNSSMFPRVRCPNQPRLRAPFSVNGCAWSGGGSRWSLPRRKPPAPRKSAPGHQSTPWPAGPGMATASR